MPTCCPRCVEPLCFLVRRNPTVQLPEILERRYSLSKKNHKMATASPFFISRFLFLFHFPSFLLQILFLCFYSFIFLFFSFSHFSSHSLSFSPNFLISLCISLLLFGALTVWVKRRKFPPPLPQAKCVAIPFPFLFFYFIIPLYDIITYMAQCEPWNSCHPCGSM